MRKISLLLMVLCLHVVAVHAQQVFTIDGYVDENIADSCYNIYLGDEYFNIQGDEPVATVPIVNKRFTYSVPLDKITAGRIRCIFPNGELCSASIELFFVPGETIKLTVRNGYYNWDYPDSYSRKVRRGLHAAREATGWQSPHLPKLKGKVWKDVAHVSHESLDVKDVIFAKDETVLRFTSDSPLYNMIVKKGTFLQDEHGNKYGLKRMVYGEPLDENNGPEGKTYGVYCAFEPLPKDVKRFDVFAPDSYGGESVIISNVQKAEKQKKRKPNFQMNIQITEGIDDTGYIVELYNKHEGFTKRQVADISATGKTCSFETYIDKPYLADVTATFPDGSVCSHCVRLPFVPNETVEVKVMNGRFNLDGSKFYKEWANADDFAENSRPYRTVQETEELLKNYLRQHATEEGCVHYFVQERLLKKQALREIVPQEVWEGRMKDVFQFLMSTWRESRD